MIIIAGAGIGGLTLGCALARAGRPFRILERAVELRPAGAGIALSENALRALAHIGLADAVRACGQDLAVAAICDQHGRALIEHRVRKLTRRSGNHLHSWLPPSGGRSHGAPVFTDLQHLCDCMALRSQVRVFGRVGDQARAEATYLE